MSLQFFSLFGVEKKKILSKIEGMTVVFLKNDPHVIVDNFVESGDFSAF